RDEGLGVALVEAREDVAAEGALELALRERVGELEERRGGGRGREEFEIGEQPELTRRAEAALDARAIEALERQRAPRVEHLRREGGDARAEGRLELCRVLDAVKLDETVDQVFVGHLALTSEIVLDVDAGLAQEAERVAPPHDTVAESIVEDHGSVPDHVGKMRVAHARSLVGERGERDVVRGDEPVGAAVEEVLEDGARAAVPRLGVGPAEELVEEE